nr:hypothetical protein [Halalkalibacter akibai]
MQNRYHCCATCRHFSATKESGGMKYSCIRLGFETKTTYTFDCWDPKDNVKKLIQKEGYSSSSS